MLVDSPPHLQGSHEEADTLIAFHFANVHEKGNVLIRASDTDIMVIIIGMIGREIGSEKETPILHAIMDCGSSNSRRYIL